MIEPPYGTILRRLEQGLVVPFLGAGASLVGRTQGDVWNTKAAFPPRGAELSAHLAKQATFSAICQDERDQEDLLKVAAYFEEQSGRSELLRELHQLLARNFTPGPLHAFLASQSALKLFVTTNYDTLLERAFRDLDRSFDLVVYPKDSDETGSFLLWWPDGSHEPESLSAGMLPTDLLEKTTVIFKMHGTVDDRQQGHWDNYVVTEDDYIDFLSRMTIGTAVPPSFYKHFRGRSFLFLGYGLADWNLRVVLRNLGREFEANALRQGGTKHWAIQHGPASIEQWLWHSRNVNVYDQQLDDFVDRLQATQHGQGGEQRA